MTDFNVAVCHKLTKHPRPVEPLGEMQSLLGCFLPKQAKEVKSVPNQDYCSNVSWSYHCQIVWGLLYHQDRLSWTIWKCHLVASCRCERTSLPSLPTLVHLCLDSVLQGRTAWSTPLQCLSTALNPSPDGVSGSGRKLWRVITKAPSL